MFSFLVLTVLTSDSLSRHLALCGIPKNGLMKLMDDFFISTTRPLKRAPSPKWSPASASESSKNASAYAAAAFLFPFSTFSSCFEKFAFWSLCASHSQRGNLVALPVGFLHLSLPKRLLSLMLFLWKRNNKFLEIHHISMEMRRRRSLKKSEK